MSSQRAARCQFSEMSGSLELGAKHMRSVHAGVAVSGSEVSTDMLAAYVLPIAEAGAAAYDRYGSAEAGEDELGMINTLHARL